RDGVHDPGQRVERLEHEAEAQRDRREQRSQHEPHPYRDERELEMLHERGAALVQMITDVVPSDERLAQPAEQPGAHVPNPLPMRPTSSMPRYRPSSSMTITTCVGELTNESSACRSESEGFTATGNRVGSISLIR